MNTLLDPAILFFVFGVLAGLMGSNLEIPKPISHFLSLYLLMALGLKGGFALAETGLDFNVAKSLGVAFLLAWLIPIGAYAFLRRHAAPLDAIAIAAAYGSVSAVTFVTAIQFLDGQGLQPGGHMAAALVIMESPAVIFAVSMANRLRRQSVAGNAMAQSGAGHHLRESLTQGAQLLLLGGMAIGWITGDAGREVMQPFSIDLFKGMLAFFLLDMGLQVARNVKDVRAASPMLVLFALIAPPLHALFALGICMLASISLPDTILLMVLAASASYIVVPAVLRHAIPEARPALYFGMSLVVTFPLNLIFGIPLYTFLAQQVML